MVGYCPHCLSPIAWELVPSDQPVEVECPECGHVFRQEGQATSSGASTVAPAHRWRRTPSYPLLSAPIELSA